MERIPSGVTGLDPLIGGGLPKNSTVLLSGITGTGKTIFSLHFLLEGARNGDNTVYLTLDESPRDILAYSKAFKWDMEDHLEKNLFVRGVELYNFEGLVTTIENLVTNYSPSRMAIDSITTLGHLFRNEFSLIKGIRSLIRTLERMKITTILSCRLREGRGGISNFGVEEYLVDGIIVLHFLRKENEYFRALSVRKMRGTNHSIAMHPMTIDENGITVFPDQRVI